MTDFTDPKLLIKKVKSDFDKLVKDEDMWDEIGKKAVTQIKGLTQKGFGIEDKLGNPKEFEALKASTIRKRKVTKANKKMIKVTTPEKSNLRETGQMFEDLTHFPDETKVEINFKTERSKEIASYHNKGGGRLPKRAFMNLSKEQFRILVSIFNKYIAKKLRRN